MTLRSSRCWIEAHYSHYRSPDGIRNGGLVAAKFDHATSCNLDPQLHSHVFVLNAMRCSDGHYLANEPKALFQDQKSLGLLYRQELAHQLRERGFEIAISDRSQMFIKLKGIDQGLAEHFSSRRAAIEEQVARWKEEGKFGGIPHARLHEMNSTIQQEHQVPNLGRAVPQLGKNLAPRAAVPPAKAIVIDLDK